MQGDHDAINPLAARRVSQETTVGFVSWSQTNSGFPPKDSINLKKKERKKSSSRSRSHQIVEKLECYMQRLFIISRQGFTESI